VREWRPYREVPFAITEQYEIRQRPVAALSQNYIEVSVAIQIAEADVGCSLAVFLQRHKLLKGPRPLPREQEKAGTYDNARDRDEDFHWFTFRNEMVPLLRSSSGRRLATPIANRLPRRIRSTFFVTRRTPLGCLCRCMTCD